MRLYFRLIGLLFFNQIEINTMRKSLFICLGLHGAGLFDECL